MNNLIKRQDALDALGAEPEVWIDDDEYTKGMNAQWKYDRKAIEALPSAERKGKWIKESLTTDYPYKCSACKKYSRAMYDFCPQCGADMRGEEE